MKRNKWKLIIAVIAVLMVGMTLIIFLNLPKPVVSSDSAYDLSQISDGTYIGNCDNKIIKVQAEVEITDNAIADVRIMKHNNGFGTPAEAITNAIVAQQSVEIEAISGATLSSKTILKAVENALSGSVKGE